MLNSSNFSLNIRDFLICTQLPPYPFSEGHFTIGKIYQIIAFGDTNQDDKIMWLRSDKHIPFSLAVDKCQHCFVDANTAAKVLYGK